MSNQSRSEEGTTPGQESADPFGALQRVDEEPTGVRLEDPNRATPGLTIFHTVVANKILVIDLDGVVQLEFAKTPPGFHFYRPGKAGDNRNVYCILKSTSDSADRAIASISEDGNVIWRTPYHHFTHDFHIRHNRRIVTVLREDRELEGHKLSNNVICEMDLNGEIRWEWSLLDNVHKLTIGEEILQDILRYKNDNPFHINSVQIADYPIVIEKLGEAAIVASSRNMNSVFVFGIESGEVLFEYSGETLGQHHARILPEVYASGGNLIIVDNGYNFRPPHKGRSRGYSRVVEIAIPDGRIVWEYRSRKDQPLFFSPIVGAQQRFQNGNTLITEGYYGRIFEIDYEGEILWDYVYPPSNNLEEHLHGTTLAQTGLRQIYRAYRVGYDWME